jgi:hypothetical protein
VPTGRGAVEEAERHARLAEEAADSLDYGQEKLYAAMARALVYQAAGDYLGMADALAHWRDDGALDGRSRAYAVLWRPLLIEGLVGSGQTELAAAVLDQLRHHNSQVGYLRPGLAWLEGWLAEQRGAPEEAERIYQDGEGSASAQKPGLYGPAAAGPRPAPAADRPAAPGGRAAAAGERLVPGPAGRAVHRPDRSGTGGLSSSG